MSVKRYVVNVGIKNAFIMAIIIMLRNYSGKLGRILSA